MLLTYLHKIFIYYILIYFYVRIYIYIYSFHGHRGHSYLWNNFLLEKPKTWLGDNYISGQMRRKPHEGGWKRRGHSLARNPTPNVASHNQEGPKKQEFLPEEQVVYTLTLGILTLGTYT